MQLASNKTAMDNRVAIFASDVLLASFKDHGEVDVNVSSFNATGQITVFILRKEEVLFHRSINLFHTGADIELIKMLQIIRGYEVSEPNPFNKLAS